jgi:molybdate transport system substrate-binding protein
VYALVDASLHDPLRQTVAVMEGSVRADEAIAFLRFLGTPAARDIMERYGFTLPGSTSADDAPSGADSARAPSP